MKLHPVFATTSLVLLAACGQSGTGASAVVQAAPVAGKAAPAGQSWGDVVAKTDDGGMRMGNPDAPIKLIEYGARTCPTCARFDTEGLPKLKAGLVASGKVSYEFRDYPVHGALDIGPILLGHCVESAQFFPMLDEMMRSQRELLASAEKFTPAEQAEFQKLSPNELATTLAERLGYLAFVKQRGLPEAKARACLADKAAIGDIAQRAEKAGKQFNITGTPTFVINGKVAEGVLDWDGLKAALTAAGA